MKITLEAHSTPDAFIIRNHKMVLKTSADVAEWKRQLTEEIKAKIEPGQKVYFLVDIADVFIDPSVSEEYGRTVKDAIFPMSHSIIRFGSQKGMTAAVIEAEAVLNSYPGQILADEKAASAYLQRIKGF